MVIVLYLDVAITSKEQSTKNLLALVLDVDKSLVEVQYGKRVGQSLKHFMIVPNDKGYVTNDDVIWVLPYPILTHGVNEFTEDIRVDLV